MTDLFSKIIIVNNTPTPDKGIVEIVERKGIGHPDTLADIMAETISLQYSKYSLENFGVIPHHHVDKLYIKGGKWIVGFGTSEFVSPINIIVGGRFSLSFGNKKIDVEGIVNDAIRNVLSSLLPAIDFDKHVIVRCYFNSSSHTERWYTPIDENDLPDVKNEWANDTSVVVSYFPFTKSENIAIEAESYFHSNSARTKYNFIGRDIKSMVFRERDRYDITLCVPFFAEKTPDINFYRDTQIEIAKDIHLYLGEHFGHTDNLHIHINTQDNNIYRKHHYLTAIGSALDAGEEGLVGRGNSAHGFIASFRPFSMEACFGKNPTYHTGKLYSILGRDLAEHLSTEFDQAVSVIAMTQNGGGVRPPFRLVIQTEGVVDEALVEQVARNALSKMNPRSRILDGGVIENLLHTQEGFFTNVNTSI